MGERDRLEKQLTKTAVERECYLAKYHKVDKDLAVARQGQNISWASDVIFGGTTTLGGAIFTLGLSLTAMHPHLDWILVIAGLALIVIGVVAKVVIR